MGRVRTDGGSVERAKLIGRGGWLRRGVGWLARRKKRVAGVVCAVVIGGYGVAYAVAEGAVSPTDWRMVLEDGRTLAYSVHRTGKWVDGVARTRVILLHGAPTDASSWGRVIEAAREREEPTEWIAVDRLGYGNSSREVEVSLKAHAESVRRFVEEAGSGVRVVLVGHSYGGPVALRAAIEFADRVDGLVLVAGACDAEMEDAQWFRRLVDGAGVAVPRAWSAANRELLALTDENDAMRGMLGRVRCPVTIIHGTWDPVCPYEGTTGYLQKMLVNAERVEVVGIERGGHNLHVGEAGEVVRHVNGNG